MFQELRVHTTFALFLSFSCFCMTHSHHNDLTFFFPKVLACMHIMHICIYSYPSMYMYVCLYISIYMYASCVSVYVSVFLKKSGSAFHDLL
jgi:hypothetical protein